MSDDAFRFVNSILETKKYVMHTDMDEKDYQPFITNRALSQHIDSIMYANEINQYSNLSNKMQYDYYFHAIRKMKRKFAKWPKKVKDDGVDLVMEYFQISRQKAEEYMMVLSNEDLDKIQDSMVKGG